MDYTVIKGIYDKNQHAFLRFGLENTWKLHREAGPDLDQRLTKSCWLHSRWAFFDIHGPHLLVGDLEPLLHTMSFDSSSHK